MARKKSRNNRRRKSRRSRRRRFVGGEPTLIAYVKLNEQNKGILSTNSMFGMRLHFANGSVTYGTQGILIGEYEKGMIDEGHYNVQPFYGVPFYGSKDRNQPKTLIAHVEINNNKYAEPLSKNSGYNSYIPLNFENGKVKYGENPIGRYKEIISKEGEGYYYVEPFDIDVVAFYGVKDTTAQKKTLSSEPVVMKQSTSVYGMMPDIGADPGTKTERPLAENSLLPNNDTGSGIYVDPDDFINRRPKKAIPLPNNLYGDLPDYPNAMKYYLGRK
jgi:hypothetical protein